MYNIKSIVLSLYLLVPLIRRWSLKNYVFTFIDFGNKGLGFLELTLDILKSSYSYVIYDWSYGIISNFRSIFLNTHSLSSNTLPTVAFLFNMDCQEHLVNVELKNRCVLSVGLVNYALSSLVDYPVYINSKSEVSIVFLKFFLKNINYNIFPMLEINRIFDANWNPQKAFDKQKWSFYKSTHSKFNYKALDYGQSKPKFKKNYVYYSTDINTPTVRYNDS